MSSPRMACYRYYDDTGKTIYVGITGSITKRHSEHMRERIWAPEVWSMFVEWFDSAELAQHRELELINTLQPKYNIAGKTAKSILYPNPDSLKEVK